MQQDQYFVYIMTNKDNKVLYTGVTNDLMRRVHEHKNKLMGGFTTKYNANKLVYFESTNDVREAILMEKKIKAGSRKKKIALIERFNPDWKEIIVDAYLDNSGSPVIATPSLSRGKQSPV